MRLTCALFMSSLFLLLSAFHPQASLFAVWNPLLRSTGAPTQESRPLSPLEGGGFRHCRSARMEQSTRPRPESEWVVVTGVCYSFTDPEGMEG